MKFLDVLLSKLDVYLDVKFDVTHLTLDWLDLDGLRVLVVDDEDSCELPCWCFILVLVDKDDKDLSDLFF